MNPMAQSKTWNDEVSISTGIPTSGQTIDSCFSNQQFEQNLGAACTINNQTNNNIDYRIHSSNGKDVMAGLPMFQMGRPNNNLPNNTPASKKFHTPFDLSFDDPVESFSEYANVQATHGDQMPNAFNSGLSTGGEFQNRQFGQFSMQPTHLPSQSNMLSWHAVAECPAAHGGGASKSIKMDSINMPKNSDQVSHKFANRFLLGAKVQPFTRSSDDGVDDDLFRVFEDDVGSQATKRLPLPKPVPAKGYHPTPDVPSVSSDPSIQHQGKTPQSQSNGCNMIVPDFASLRQQEQEEEARMQKLCRIDKSSNEPRNENDDSFDGQFYVPSTMMPPTVLASTMSSMSSKRKTEKAFRSGTSGWKRARLLSKESSPQATLERLLQEAGIFEVRRVKADEAEYEVVPSALQLASFGTRVVKAVHTSDEKALSELMKCGLSPNPCNQFRDSILDLVCKRGNVAIFECLMKHGTDLQTMDGFGRTPLHHCCWASAFCHPIVDAILERDPMQLLIEDKRGQTPLEYVRTDLASEWIQYLESNIHKYWGSTIPQLSSPKAKRPSGTLPDPVNAMPVNLAAMVSSGKLLPAQVIPMIKSRRVKIA